MVRERGTNYRASAVHARIIFGLIRKLLIKKSTEKISSRTAAAPTEKSSVKKHVFRTVLAARAPPGETAEFPCVYFAGTPVAAIAAAADRRGSRTGPPRMSRRHFNIITSGLSALSARFIGIVDMSLN